LTETDAVHCPIDPLIQISANICMTAIYADQSRTIFGSNDI